MISRYLYFFYLKSIIVIKSEISSLLTCMLKIWKTFAILISERYPVSSLSSFLNSITSSVSYLVADIHYFNLSSKKIWRSLKLFPRDFDKAIISFKNLRLFLTSSKNLSVSILFLRQYLANRALYSPSVRSSSRPSPLLL